MYKLILCLLLYGNLYSQATNDSLDIILPREIRKLDSLIQIEPIADNYFYRGHYKFKSKQYNDALEDFNKCIELIPNNEEYYFNRGVVKEKIKDYNGAIKDFNSCILINKTFKKSYLNSAFAKLNLMI